MPEFSKRFPFDLHKFIARRDASPRRHRVPYRRRDGYSAGARMLSLVLAAAGRLMLRLVEHARPDLDPNSAHARAMRDVIVLFEASGCGEVHLMFRYDAEGRLISITYPRNGHSSSDQDGHEENGHPRPTS